MRRLLGLARFLLAVGDLRRLEGQDLLGAVQVGALEALELGDLVQRHEREHAQEATHVGVLGVAPVLVVVVGRGEPRIQPHGVAGGLAELLA